MTFLPRQSARPWYAAATFALLVVLATGGCGTTKSRTATQQLLVSAAVDQAISEIDFRPLAGKTVFFDTSYLNNVKGMGFVNADYIISSMRQQMAAADLRLAKKVEDAEFVVEARVGAVGTDSNDMVYGIPASTGLSTAASLVPNAPPIPLIPEISIARKEAELGAAKIAVFAYHRDSRQPVWQSGVTQARSSAQDFWVFGAGPFQRGSIYEKTHFAGQELRLPRIVGSGRFQRLPRIAYHEQHTFEMVDDETRLAKRKEINTLLENLPKASAEEWLAPLQPPIKTSFEERFDRR